MPDFPNPIARRPVGKAIVRTPQQLAEVARIDQQTIQRTRLDWMGWAPARWQGLLEARVEAEWDQT